MQKYNENLEQKRKDARVIGKLGAALMSSSLVLFLITLFYYYAILIPAHPYDKLSPFIAIAAPVLFDMLIFMLGCILLLIGLLVGLIGRLKKG
jgi:hypothetical protein